MILNETQQKWSNIITEEYGVKDQNKLAWMSQYAQNHEIYEGQQSPAVDASHNIYATPLNTMGIGNPQNPQMGYAGGAFDPAAKVGSGDIPMSTLTMALEVAAVTIGLELVPVIPANGPWAMLSYMDTPYAGGKYDAIGNLTGVDGKGPDAQNKPIYVKLNVDRDAMPADLAQGDELCFKTKDAAGDHGEFNGKFIGWSRIDNSMIVETLNAFDIKGDAPIDASIAYVFTQDNAYLAKILRGDAVIYNPAADAVHVRPDLVATFADHVQGFSNFAKGIDDPMSRAENETGVGNTIGARMFTKLVQMGAYEVTGTVTRQQLQDMPLYGIDVIGKVLESMQNEISQAINNRILDRVFRLGVDNADIQYGYQKVNLNLYLNDVNGKGCPMGQFPAWNKYRGMSNEAPKYLKASLDVPNAIQNTAAENVTTHQRRIMSRLLAAANLIANVSRRGRGQWAVTNTQILSALQDAASFVVAPMVNNLAQDGSNSLYFAGSIAGLNLYVDPYMPWDDCRICVGRKSNGNDPGVIFMPYILADTVQTVAEGTMAPKLLVNSRFAIVDAGFHPEQSYYTFMVHTAGDGAYLI